MINKNILFVTKRKEKNILYGLFYFSLDEIKIHIYETLKNIKEKIHIGSLSRKKKVQFFNIYLEELLLPYY